jgi:hypothetical protein
LHSNFWWKSQKGEPVSWIARIECPTLSTFFCQHPVCRNLKLFKRVRFSNQITSSQNNCWVNFPSKGIELRKYYY